MIVLDASIVVGFLTDRALVEAQKPNPDSHSDPLFAPHLLDVGVANALGRMDAAGRIDSHHTHELLTELRHNFTAYDATYIALAEALGVTLYTCDRKLCKGHRARVALFTDQEPAVFGPK